MDFHNFTRVEVLEVDCPAVGLLPYRGDILAQLGDLHLGERLERAHHFFDARDFLRKGVVGHPGMLNGLLLQSVHFAHHVTQRSFQDCLLRFYRI